MTSLVPGVVFPTPGLNRRSTRVSPTATPSEIDAKYARAPLNGSPWPRDSPVARVYDVCNTSTKLILYNNERSRVNDRALRAQTRTQLRGQTKSAGSIQRPSPERHQSPEPRVNRHHHTNCTVSQTERFQPRPHSVLSWRDKPILYDNKSPVNPKYHAPCKVSRDNEGLRWEKPRLYRRPRSTTSLPPYLAGGKGAAGESQFTKGEKTYLWSIARIYSVDNLKRLKQDQYLNLLAQEKQRGTHSKADVQRYSNYLSSPRRTTSAPSIRRRQTPARGQDKPPSPRTRQQKQQRQQAQAGRSYPRRLNDSFSSSRTSSSTTAQSRGSSRATQSQSSSAQSRASARSSQPGSAPSQSQDRPPDSRDRSPASSRSRDSSRSGYSSDGSPESTPRSEKRDDEKEEKKVKKEEDKKVKEEKAKEEENTVKEKEGKEETDKTDGEKEKEEEATKDAAEDKSCQEEEHTVTEESRAKEQEAETDKQQEQEQEKKDNHQLALLRDVLPEMSAGQQDEEDLDSQTATYTSDKGQKQAGDVKKSDSDGKEGKGRESPPEKKDQEEITPRSSSSERHHQEGRDRPKSRIGRTNAQGQRMESDSEDDYDDDFDTELEDDRTKSANETSTSQAESSRQEETYRKLPSPPGSQEHARRADYLDSPKGDGSEGYVVYTDSRQGDGDRAPEVPPGTETYTKVGGDISVPPSPPESPRPQGPDTRGDNPDSPPSPPPRSPLPGPAEYAPRSHDDRTPSPAPPARSPLPGPAEYAPRSHDDRTPSPAPPARSPLPGPAEYAPRSHDDRTPSPAPPARSPLPGPAEYAPRGRDARTPSPAPARSPSPAVRPPSPAPARTSSPPRRKDSIEEGREERTEVTDVDKIEY